MDRLELPNAVVRGPLVEFSTHTALVRLPTGGAVLVDSTGVVAVDVAADGHHADVIAALAAPAAGAAALLAGRFAVRASAVSVAGGIGGSGAVVIGAVAAGGASTMTAALGGRGHLVLSDAVTVLHGSPLMVTAHGGDVDLWPDSAVALGLRAADGVVIREGLTKHRFTLAAAVRAVPLAAVVQLELVNRELDPLAYVLGGAEAVDVVLTLMWHRWALAGLGREAAALAWAVYVAQANAVMRVVVSRRSDPCLMAEFIERVLT